MNSALPKELLASLEGVKGYDASAFEKVHAEGGQSASIRFNPLKQPMGPCVDSGRIEKIPWSSFGYYLEERPSYTFDPLFHAGVYYVQEASSMFLEQALKQTVDLTRRVRVLDLCAAPGGKSTLIQSLISRDSLLVSNEVIRARAGILEENIVKWGAANVVVTSNDPRDFGRMENYFDVIVVDAPCSGSGLFRREPDAIREWSEENVLLCSGRQKRILSDSWAALKEGGVLIYSTCSYSKEEDEDILDWMMGEFGVDSLKLAVEDSWNIVETISTKGGYGYRFFPDKVKGEGFFICCLQKKEGGVFAYPRNRKGIAGKLTKQEEHQLNDWVKPELSLFFFKHNEQVHGLPAQSAEDLPLLQTAFYLKKAGVRMGKLTAKEFIPEHDFALSALISRDIRAIEVSKEDAIQYLRKEEIRADGEQKGWALVRYKGQNLGWVKILSGRVNNYYPKDWRILKRG